MLNALMVVIFETLKAMLFKIAFKTVVERFTCRVVIWGGDKLVKMTTNDLDDKTWLDIRRQLTGKRLKVADESFDKSVANDFGGWSK
jgi:hypothetical protein